MGDATLINVDTLGLLTLSTIISYFILYVFTCDVGTEKEDISYVTSITVLINDTVDSAKITLNEKLRNLMGSHLLPHFLDVSLSGSTYHASSYMWNLKVVDFGVHNKGKIITMYGLCIWWKKGRLQPSNTNHHHHHHHFHPVLVLVFVHEYSRNVDIYVACNSRIGKSSK